MLSPHQCLAVWDAIKQGPRPQETDEIFKLLITHVEINTGIMCLTREEIADRVGIEPSKVSAAMGRLEKMGVVSRERVKVPGMKGPGKVRYRLNPHVGWNGKLENRELQAKEEQPPLPFTVIEGGEPA